MTVADTLRARIAEVDACIAAVADNNFARQVLSARRAALTDVLAIIEQTRMAVSLDQVMQYLDEDLLADRPTEKRSGSASREPHAMESTGGDSRERPAPQIPPADRGTLADDEPSPDRKSVV